MSKSKAEVAKDLYNEFIREIGEVAIAGDDESDVRNESVKHLLTARSKFESLMRLLKDTERSGSTLPSIVGDASADSKYSTPTTDVKSVTSHSSKLETCIEKLSTAFELLTTKGTRPVAGSSQVCKASFQPDQLSHPLLEYEIAISISIFGIS